MCVCVFFIKGACLRKDALVRAGQAKQTRLWPWLVLNHQDVAVLQISSMLTLAPGASLVRLVRWCRHDTTPLRTTEQIACSHPLVCLYLDCSHTVRVPSTIRPALFPLRPLTSLHPRSMAIQRGKR